MKSKFTIFLGLILLSLSSFIGAQELNLQSYNIGLFKAKDRDSYTKPLIISSEKDWQKFNKEIKKINQPDNSNRMTKVTDYFSEDIDFDTNFAIVVFRDALRTGLIRLESAKYNKGIIELSLAQVPINGSDLRPNDEYEYNIYVLPKKSDTNLIDVKTNLTLLKPTPPYYMSYDEDSGLYGIRSNTKSGWLVNPKYLEAYEFDPYGHAFVTIKEKTWVLIDYQGNVLYDIHLFDTVPDYPKAGLIRFFDKNQKLGFLNIQGKVIIKAQFEDADHFMDGKAKIYRGGTWTKQNDRYLYPHYTGGEFNYIDDTGKIIGKWEKRPQDE